MMTFLNPTEEDRLRIFLVAELARRTRSLGLRLNAPEAVALIADEMHFAARAGKGYDDVVGVGMNALSEEQVMDGVPDIVTQIRVEVLLEEGSRLIVLPHPIGNGGRTTASISPVGERA
jgi:urease subunit gamma/beta